VRWSSDSGLLVSAEGRWSGAAARRGRRLTQPSLRRPAAPWPRASVAVAAAAPAATSCRGRAGEKRNWGGAARGGGGAGEALPHAGVASAPVHRRQRASAALLVTGGAESPRRLGAGCEVCDMAQSLVGRV
jgi:hypothetical protein